MLLATTTETAGTPAVVPTETWDLARIPADARLAEWGRVLTETQVTCHARAVGDESAFSASIRRHRFGDLALLDMSSTPYRGVRTRHDIASDVRDVVGLQWILSGRERVDLERRAFQMSAGDVLFWDACIPVEFEVATAVHKRMLILPRDVVASAVTDYRLGLGRMSMANATTRTLVAVLQLMVSELPSLDVAGRAAAANAIIALLGGLGAAEEGGSAALRVTLRDALLDHVERHLDDPDLAPAKIAAAHSISIRTLYACFAELGLTVSGYIRERRLSRCYTDLSSGGSRTVTEVARRWGFHEPAHFSRVFRRRYGVPPSRLLAGR